MPKIIIILSKKVWGFKKNVIYLYYKSIMMKKKSKAKYNIFQGNKLINTIVADSLGYKVSKEEIEHGWFTKDIFTSAYFYMCHRFGFPKTKTFDEYKEAGAWHFKVKDYTISVRLNSSWVTFMVYGKSNKFPHVPLSPYQLKRQRAFKKHRKKLIDPFNEKKSKTELKITEKLWKSFCKEYLDETWTAERYNNDSQMRNKWFNYQNAYNNKVSNIPSWQECEEKYGEFVVNSNIRHAQRTLGQFIKNLLTPIYIRDVPYNIKGRISDEKAWEYERRFAKNILIKLEK
jgi:hypothetical protein